MKVLKSYITVNLVDVKNCIINGIFLENERNNIVKCGTVTGCIVIIFYYPFYFGIL